MDWFLYDRNLHHVRVHPDKLHPILADKGKSSHPKEIITTELKPVKVLPSVKFLKAHIDDKMN